MSKFTLTAQTALGGVQHNFENVSIAEVTDRAIMSIATPMDGRKALSKAIASTFKTEIPAVGETTTSNFAASRFLGLQADLLFLLFSEEPGSAGKIESALKDTAYLTEQSDSWVMIVMSGSKSRVALERICPIDLHPDTFSEGNVARTTMEHLGAIIVREGPDSFLLISPRSSAKSFLHALETSVQNIL